MLRLQTVDESLLRSRLKQRASQLRKVHMHHAEEAMKEEKTRKYLVYTESKPGIKIKGPAQTAPKTTKNWWNEI